MKYPYPGPNELVPVDVFDVLINRERARADRSGSEFSLVVYPLEEGGKSRRPLRTLEGALRRRVRSIDEIGWFQEGVVAVLLPATGLKGAQRFAESFAHSLNGRGQVLPFSVFSYPSCWYQQGVRSWDRRDPDGCPDPPGTPGGGSTGESGRSASPPADLADAYTRIEAKVSSVLARRIPRWKRALDVTGAVVGIAVCAPVFALLAAYIRIISPGPVFFRQERVGYAGRSFTFLKFRTMRVDNDESSHREHLKNLIHSQAAMAKLDAVDDPRIIPGGKILRRACLDELPQLFNVLKGEMSLVGPRPCLPYEAEEYQRWHAGRFDVLPGMTGLWQVSGKNNLSFQKMIRLDIAYSQSIRLVNDLRILFRTGPAVVGYVLEAVGRRLGAGHAQPSAERQADSTPAR